MASNRHLGRIITLQTLYEQEFRIDCGDKALKLDEVLERNIDRYSKTVDDVDFIRSFVFGVSEKAKQLDELLQPIAPDGHWIRLLEWTL
jgi:N utilization substance protein B